MTKKIRFGVVGNGKMADDIVKLIAINPNTEVLICFNDPSETTYYSTLRQTCEDQGILYFHSKHINDLKTLKKLKSLNLTYIISANNKQIFKSDFLTIPKKGIINFHNGPLPSYGGLNSCSWAIINGENTHGITWHLVEKSIDTGPILAQRIFKISPDERAITLIARCIHEGIQLFKCLLDKIISKTISPIEQDQRKLKYYGKYDLPFKGQLPWWMGANVLDRLERALNFHPMPNMFYLPSLKIKNHNPVLVKEFVINQEKLGSTGKIKIFEKKILVCSSDCTIEIENLYDVHRKIIPFSKISNKYGFIDGVNLIFD